MSRFLNHASEIFETAACSPEGSSAALTIMISAQGQIHIVDGAESPLDSLQNQHGYEAAYRVTRTGAHLRVEGREGSSSCVLEDRQAKSFNQTKPRKKSFVPAGLFCDQPLYSLTSALTA